MWYVFNLVPCTVQGRCLSDQFMKLPEKVELPPDDFPKPSKQPPTGIACGTVDMLGPNGKLPNMAKRLPTEEELRTWNTASQQAFWEQRRTFWGSGKGSGGSGWSGWTVGDLQRQLRKRDIWPGGDIPFLRDRLLRYDFCRSQLLPCELRTEAEGVEAEMQVGVLYYKVVSKPIDLGMIKQRLAAQEYPSIDEMEKDLLLLFSNARKFDVSWRHCLLCPSARGEANTTSLAATGCGQRPR